MNTRRATLRFHAVLLLLIVCQTALAEAVIDIRFDREPATGQEEIRAQAAYTSHGTALRNVLMAFSQYAELHPWITETTATYQPQTGKTGLLIRFKFPWPVGRRWSRIEITTDNRQVISWQQVDGTMKANRGRLKFNGSGETLEVAYSAVISIGLPGAWTRSFKQRFVTEFIEAAYSRAAESDVTGLLIADTSAK